ncbi:MAG: hypothetical protein ACHREM_13185 [Polyangiales bacterium]
MPIAPTDEALAAIDAIATRAQGDTERLVAEVSAAFPSLEDRAATAAWLEAAARRRATAGDRPSAWSLACAVATARSSALVEVREEAERTLARVFGELRECASARADLPENLAWIVAGARAPNADAATIELARRNASAHLERLDAELAARSDRLLRCARAGDLATVAKAIASYEAAAVDVRAALQRALDHVLARIDAHADAPALSQAAASCLAVVDDAVVPALRRRIAAIKATLVR